MGDPNYTSNILLLHLNGTNGSSTFTDTSPTPKTPTLVGAPVISTAQSKFGGASFYSPGAGVDYIYYDNTTGTFDLGTGDFTIECFFRLATAEATNILIDGGTPGSFDYALAIIAGDKAYYDISGVNAITGTTIISANTWHHIAIARSGTSTKLFLNGVQEGSTYTDTNNYVISSNNLFNIRSGNTSYIDEFRFTKGFCRYTTTFTPTTTEFSDSNMTTYNDTISETIAVTTTVVDTKNPTVVYSSISEALSVVTSSTSLQILQVLETILITTTISSLGNLKNTVNEYITVIDNILIVVKELINESLINTDTIIGIISKVELILENLILSTSLTSGSLFLNTLLDSIFILESTASGFLKTINESLVVQDLITSLYRAVATISESAINTDSNSIKYITFLSLSETLNISDVNSTRATLVNSILESLIITIPTATGQDTYSAFLLSPETGSVSTYNNYNFNGCTKFNDKYLFYNTSGLYEYGGTLDDTSLITANIQTIAYNFNSSNLKQIPSMYMGINTDGATILKVSVDGKGQAIYKLNKRTNNLQTQKVSIGKGLIGRYFQFELVTSAPNFSLESFEFFPIELRRKL